MASLRSTVQVGNYPFEIPCVHGFCLILFNLNAKINKGSEKTKTMLLIYQSMSLF